MNSFAKIIFRTFIMPYLYLFLAFIVFFYLFSRENNILGNSIQELTEQSIKIENLKSLTEDVVHTKTKRESFYLKNEETKLINEVKIRINDLEEKYVQKSNTQSELNNTIFMIKTELNSLNKDIEELIINLSKLGHKNWGLVGDWRKNIHELEGILTKYHDDPLKVTLLQLRRHEKDYLLRNEAKYIAKVADRVEELESKLKQDRRYNHALSLTKHYIQIFNAYVELETKIGADNVSGIRGKIFDKVNSINKNNLKLVNLLKTNLKSLQERMIIVMFILFLFAMLILSKYTQNFSDKFTNPIMLLKNSFNEMGEGNLHQYINYESENEFKSLIDGFNRLSKTLEKQRIDIIEEKETTNTIINSLSEFIILADVDEEIITINKSLKSKIKTANPKKIKDILKFKKAYDIRSNLNNISGEIMTGERSIPVSFNSKLVTLEDRELIVISAKDIRDTKELSDLRETQEQLVQSAKLASLGEMSSSLGHELNNPLQIILGFATELQQGMYKKSSTEEMIIYIEHILSSARRMNSIIEHLRSFSRIDNKTFESHDVRDILNDSFILLENAFKISQVKKTASIPDVPLLVNCRRIQLEQVFINIFKNAIDAMESNISEDREVTYSIRPDSENILIRITNNGGTISKDIVEKIFDPFFTTKEIGKGTGLGLSISYKIINDHNGSIDVDTSINDKTSFIIKLPRIITEQT